MSIQVTVRDSSVTKGMKNYATEKVERLLKFFDGIQKIEVILGTEGPKKHAEIVVTITKGDPIATHAVHDQMNAAIDMVLDRAERSVVKFKEKLKDHRGPSVAEASTPPATTGGDENLESYDDIIEKTEFPK